MATLDIDGRSLYYEVHGEGEPLLCVHGLSVDTLGWALQVPAFSQSHRTVVFDNRDVGQSSYVEAEYEVADMARDALALADELGLETFHLIGISMGGAIAQEIALSAPERIRTLTLTVTFPRGGPWAHKLAEVWSVRVSEMPHERHIDELMLLNHSEEFYENPEGVRYLRDMILSNPHPQKPEGFARQLAASSRHDALDRLPTLEMPVHVIGGERDILVPVWKSAELSKLIPGARLTVLERAPHGLSLERAEEFNRVVLDFVAEHESTATV
ncbi:MAG: alpha/beta fold hydrolase [Thermoleophilaceae bacterium]|nr:alpha/beta fold hydrolase [Thermoleophilaceae bacterium]